jgi:hypothetical protein
MPERALSRGQRTATGITPQLLNIRMSNSAGAIMAATTRGDSR